MSDSNDITVLKSGVYKNLLAQIESIYKHSTASDTPMPREPTLKRWKRDQRKHERL